MTVQTEEPPGNNNWGITNIEGVLYRIGKSPIGTSFGGYGDLERSTDDGVTWPVVLAQAADEGVQGFCMGANATMYALWGAHVVTTKPLKVFRSTDNGVTWVEVFDEGGTGPAAMLPMSIAAHPTDKDIVVIACTRNSGGNRLLESINATAISPTWTLRTPTVTAGSLAGSWVAFADSGRIVLVNGSNVQTTENRGVNWIVRDTPGGTDANWLHNFEGRMMYAIQELSGDGGELRISYNGGVTWEVYINGTDLPGGGPTGSYCYAGVMDAAGALCLFFQGGSYDVAWWRQPDPWASTLPAWQPIAYGASGGSVEVKGASGIPVMNQ